MGGFFRGSAYIGSSGFGVRATLLFWQSLLGTLKARTFRKLGIFISSGR